MPNIIWLPAARVLMMTPGMLASFCRRSEAISSLDLGRLDLGRSLRVKFPVLAPLRQPPPPRLSSMLTCSGTSRLMISAITRNFSSMMLSLVPTSISTETRTSPSSVTGMNSLPTKPIKAMLPARSKAVIPRTMARWFRE